MLQPVKTQKRSGSGRRYAIVASKYNNEYVDSMLQAAEATLLAAGAKVQVVRVPGAYEIPVVTAHLARTKRFAGIICLGVILRGATTHAAHIGEAVSQALMVIQVETGVPVIHEVLLLENHEQARQRCLDPDHNRGLEAAQTALEMGQVIAGLKAKKP